MWVCRGRICGSGIIGLGLLRLIGEGLGKADGMPWTKKSSPHFLGDGGHLRWTEGRLSGV